MKLIINRLVKRIAFLLHVCKRKKVLHIGCSGTSHDTGEKIDKNHLHVRLHQVADEIYGVDINLSGIEELKKIGIPNLYHGDALNLQKLSLPNDFDVIVVGQLIEHIGNLDDLFESFRHSLSDKTVLVLTTPNPVSIKLALFTLFRREPTNFQHVVMHSFATLTTLLRQHGFETLRWHTAMSSGKSIIKRLIFSPFALFVRFMPQLADTLIVEASLKQ